MNKLQTKDVWVEIPVTERLPQESNWYNCYAGDKFLGQAYFSDGSFNGDTITHWLEKQSGYLFTKKELDEYDKQQNAEWKEECERLGKLVTFWQESYHKLNYPNSNQLPKIDNL
jgi:hypothetical protein